MCEEAWTTQLDSIAREARERLDQKLRSQRESMAKRYLWFLALFELIHFLLSHDSDLRVPCLLKNGWILKQETWA